MILLLVFIGIVAVAIIAAIVVEECARSREGWYEKNETDGPAW